MKPPLFEYHAPRSTTDALAMLSSLEDAKVLAGGQSLMPLLNFRLPNSAHLIDIGKLDELRLVEETEVTGASGSVTIGAAVTQSNAYMDKTVKARLPLMAAAIPYIGHFQTRNRGTVGGSLAHMDPASELNTVSCAYDAVIVAHSTTGVRRIPYKDFPTGYFSTSLREDELLSSVEFPCWPEGHGFGFEEFAFRPGDFAVVCVAALVHKDPNNVVQRCAVAIGGISTEGPVRARTAESLLLGAEVSAATLREAAEEAGRLEAVGDNKAPASYRQWLVRNLTEAALTSAASTPTP